MNFYLKTKSYVCVSGEVTYNEESGRARVVSFKTRVPITQILASLSRPTYKYNLFLEADKENYIRRLPISHEIKPGDSDLFLVQIATNRWSEFDLNFAFRTAQGKYLPAPEVLLEIFVPRTHTRYIATKRDYESLH